jgi:hypothetical protein
MLRHANLPLHRFSRGEGVEESEPLIRALRPFR